MIVRGTVGQKIGANRFMRELQPFYINLKVHARNAKQVASCAGRKDASWPANCPHELAGSGKRTGRCAKKIAKPSPQQHQTASMEN